MFTIELRFDDEKAADGFITWWLDCGGDGGGNLNWSTEYDESDKWDRHTPKWLRIKGAGEALDEKGNPIDE